MAFGFRRETKQSKEREHFFGDFAHWAAFKCSRPTALDQSKCLSNIIGLLAKNLSALPRCSSSFFSQVTNLHDILVRSKLPRELIEGSCNGCGIF